MRICVCIKQVPASNETGLDPVTHTILRESARNILNPFDAFALEEAVRLKERFGGSITVVSMGIPGAQETLRRSIAVGADEAVLLTDRAFAGADTLATAYTLSEGIRKLGGFDLILCGHMATDGDTAQVGPMIAEYLGIPHVSGVSKVESAGQGHFSVRKLTDDGYRKVRAAQPVLMTVLKEINIPRLPSLAGVLRSMEAPVTVWSARDLGADPEKTGLKGSATRVISTSRPQIHTKSIQIEGTPREQALRTMALLSDWGLMPSRGTGQDGISGRTRPAPEPGSSGAGACNGAGASAETPDPMPILLQEEEREPSCAGLWVYCEQGLDGLREVSLELLGKGRELAADLGCSVGALVQAPPGGLGAEEAAMLTRCGADEILVMQGPEIPEKGDEAFREHRMIPEDELAQTDRICDLVRRFQPQIVLIGATAFGRSLAPRVAARLRTGLTADCTGLDIAPDTGLLVQTRPAFGGNLIARILCPDRRPQMATVRPKVFPVTQILPDHPAAVFRPSPCKAESPVEVTEILPSGKGESILEAKLLVSVGQGAGGEENIALAGELAKRLGGALSGSRPLVDSGRLPYVRQVGQTGKTVSPELYIALGISGAVQHMAGVAAKKILAVNTDKDAPIFQYAQYKVQCDCGVFMKELLEVLKEQDAPGGSGAPVEKAQW